MVIPEKYQKLYQAALATRKHATAVYSNFPVGSALETTEGKIYTGCNVESSSYGLSICAERNALTKAISEGESSFKRILVVGDTPGFCSPCGACRQLLIDYAENLEVIMTNLHGDYEVADIKDLLKFYFKSEDLQNI